MKLSEVEIKVVRGNLVYFIYNSEAYFGEVNGEEITNINRWQPPSELAGNITYYLVA